MTTATIMNHSYLTVDIGTPVWNTAEAPNPPACLVPAVCGEHSPYR